MPLFIDAANGDGGPEDSYRKWAVALFHGAHSIFVNPIVTLLAVAALVVQARETLSRPSSAALSLVGLAVQAAVFILLSLSWTARLVLPWDWRDVRPALHVLITWYQLIGFVPVDHAVFAVVQAVLCWLATRHRAGIETGGETEALLRR